MCVSPPLPPSLPLSLLSPFPCSGTVEDTELVNGLVLEQKVSHIAGGLSRVEKAKIGLIQFCVSPPKTDVIHNYISFNEHLLNTKHTCIFHLMSTCSN